MICHGLRYSPFYSTIKAMLARGDIGEVVSMRTAENVSYHHMAVAYVRGKWNRAAGSTPRALSQSPGPAQPF